MTVTWLTVWPSLAYCIWIYPYKQEWNASLPLHRNSTHSWIYPYKTAVERTALPSSYRHNTVKGKMSLPYSTSLCECPLAACKQAFISTWFVFSSYKSRILCKVFSKSSFFVVYLYEGLTQKSSLIVTPCPTAFCKYQYIRELKDTVWMRQEK